MEIRSIHHLCASLLVACITSSVSAQTSWWAPSAEIVNAVMPVYLGVQTEPAVVLRVERIHRDYQKKGFFRIGALPVLALEKLSVEVREPERLTSALVHMDRRLTFSRQARQGVEARGFVLTFPGKEAGQVRARLVRFESADTWQLVEGAVERPGEPPQSFSQAHLAITGPNAGELALDNGNRILRLPLLSLAARAVSGTHKTYEPNPNHSP
jgi:hypothetical protein